MNIDNSDTRQLHAI